MEKPWVKTLIVINLFCVMKWVLMQKGHGLVINWASDLLFRWLYLDNMIWSCFEN